MKIRRIIWNFDAIGNFLYGANHLLLPWIFSHEEGTIFCGASGTNASPTCTTMLVPAMFPLGFPGCEMHHQLDLDSSAKLLTAISFTCSSHHDMLSVACHCYHLHCSWNNKRKRLSEFDVFFLAENCWREGGVHLGFWWGLPHHPGPFHRTIWWMPLGVKLKYAGTHLRIWHGSRMFSSTLDDERFQRVNPYNFNHLNRKNYFQSWMLIS